MVYAPHPSPHGPPAAHYGGVPAPPPAASPAVREALRSYVYERTALPAELEADLGHLRVAERDGRALSNALVLGGVASAALGFLALLSTRDATGLALLVAGGVAAIALFVAAGSRPTFEPLQLELASALVRRVDFAPNTPVRLRLALRRAGEKVAEQALDASTSVSEWVHRWLSLEGVLADGVALRYERTRFSRDHTTRTRTRSGLQFRSVERHWFRDAVALSYDPQRFPRAAQLGPGAHQQLHLPEGFTGHSFQNTPGLLALEVGAESAWRVGALGPAHGVDAVAVIARWCDALNALLGRASPTVRLEAQALPRADLGVGGRAMTPTRKVVRWALPAALLAAALCAAWAAADYSGLVASHEATAERLEARLRASPAGYETRAYDERTAAEERDYLDRYASSFRQYLALAVALLGGAVGSFWYLRRVQS